MKISQFTTVHPRNDVRVFFKTCVSLVNAGHEVTLFVADGQGNEIKQGVSIIDIGNYRNSRFSRYFRARKIMFRQVVHSDADIYEFHDPELLGVGLRLKKLGKVVVFDSHEDVPKQILYKSWLGPLFIRKFISKFYDSYEKRIIKRIDGLISVIDEITEKFDCSEKITLKNFPVTKIFTRYVTTLQEKNKNIIYVGSLTKERGIYDCIKALKYLPSQFRLVLIGAFPSERFKNECESLQEWERVDYKGFLPMEEVAPAVGASLIGLSVLHPEQNYLTSLPTKGFEYLAAGTPVVMSDFNYWKPYFKGCGKLVSPEDPKIIAESILSLVEDQDHYQKVQEEGMKRAKNYSWENEASKLNDFFEKLYTTQS